MKQLSVFPVLAVAASLSLGATAIRDGRDPKVSHCRGPRARFEVLSDPAGGRRDPRVFHAP